MATILGIAGSLRRESLNRRLLSAAGRQLPGGVRLHTWDELARLPFFDEDAEHDVPEPVLRLRSEIRAADGVLIATPEYNGSIPGALKNAIDWASRPFGESAFAGKPAAVIGASITPYGAKWAQEDLRKALGVAGANVVDGELRVPEAHDKFDGPHLRDDELRDTLGHLLGRLCDLCTAPAA